MRSLFNCFRVTILVMPLAFPAIAADLTVNIVGVKSAEGLVGCTLYSNANGFPLDGGKGAQQWLSAKPEDVACHFTNLNDGSYAIAASHDPNRNRITDTNFVGLPTEDWGVSNNVRPNIRAPTFEEAKFDLSNHTTIEVRLDR